MVWHHRTASLRFQRMHSVLTVDVQSGYESRLWSPETFMPTGQCARVHQISPAASAASAIHRESACHEQ